MEILPVLSVSSFSEKYYAYFHSFCVNDFTFLLTTWSLHAFEKLEKCQLTYISGSRPWWAFKPGKAFPDDEV